MDKNNSLLHLPREARPSQATEEYVTYLIFPMVILIVFVHLLVFCFLILLVFSKLSGIIIFLVLIMFLNIQFALCAHKRPPSCMLCGEEEEEESSKLQLSERETTTQQ
jgi:hypothetical protein